MNANEKPSKANRRLNRIRIVSRIVRFVTLGLFAAALVTSMFFIIPSWFPGSIKKMPVRFALYFLMQVVLWGWYRKLASLFYFYERGLVFAAETIRCIKTLGLLCVTNGLLTIIERILIFFHPLQPGILVPPGFVAHLVPPGYEVRLVSKSFGIGFFLISIEGFNFAPLLAGMIIVIIAWIMDEGRKIQEEQELTV